MTLWINGQALGSVLHFTLNRSKPKYKLSVTCCGMSMIWRGDVARCVACDHVEYIDEVRELHGISREEYY